MNLQSKLIVPGTALAACIAVSACVTAPPDTAVSDARAREQAAAAAADADAANQQGAAANATVQALQAQLKPDSAHILGAWP